MVKFYELLTNVEKEKYIKDINKYINLNENGKIKDFLLSDELFLSNVKLSPLNVKEKEIVTILDSSDNRWFILCIDGKIVLMSKKNITIHTKDFKYEKRNASFNKKYSIKKADYLIEYIDNIGANLSLSIKNYNDLIGKEKWLNEDHEITSMTLHNQKNTNLNGYTYNSNNYSLCIIGKGYEKENNILK